MRSRLVACAAVESPLTGLGSSSTLRPLFLEGSRNDTSLKNEPFKHRMKLNYNHTKTKPSLSLCLIDAARSCLAFRKLVKFHRLMFGFWGAS